MHSKWTVQLLGSLQARLGDDLVVDRFRTRKAASLFAYLAFNLKRDHSRDELVELIWPDSDGTTGRDSLKQELSSLRRQLEPPGIVPSGAVILATRSHIRLNPDAVETDAAKFESHLRRARRCDDLPERKRQLAEAIALYGGQFLPGIYDDWAVAEQGRFENLYASALHDLAALQHSAGETDEAIDTAYLAAAANPWDDGAHERLLTLLSNAGRYEAVIRQSEERARLLGHAGTAGSGAASELVNAAKASLRDRGHPVHLNPVAFEPQAPQPAPGPANVPPLPSHVHLPLQFTRFFGRDEELEGLSALLRDDRAKIVTVTGAGGAGKTRLTIEAGRRFGDADAGAEVWFIPLAAVRDGSLLLDAIAEAMDVPIAGGQSALDALVPALAARRIVLILDNFEQIVDTASAPLHELVSLLPLARALVSSRRCLNVASEVEFPVAPLNVPKEVESPLESLAAMPAIQLFVDRARAARQDFQLTPQNADTVAAVCVRLEGLPLAIELAAAWARALTPPQMLSRLSRRFDLLRSKRRDADPRHQTLHAAIDWSVQMLTDTARTLLCRLSVFRGGFSLEAVEAISGMDALDGLADLVDHSLLTLDEGDETRYQMLESVREYAAETLAGRDRECLADAHAQYYLDLAREADAHTFKPDHPEWQKRTGRDIDNFRAALEWLETVRDWERGTQLAASLWRFWQYRGLTGEGRRRLDRFLEQGDGLDDLTLARAWNAAGMLAGCEHDHANALRYSERALETLRERNDTGGVISALINIADVAMQAGRYEQAEPIYLDVTRLAAETGDRASQAIAIQGRGIVNHFKRNFETGRICFTESLALWRSIGHERGATMALQGLSGIAADDGDYDRSAALNAEILAAQRRMGDLPGIALTLYNMGDLENSLKSYDKAREYLREAAKMMVDMNQPFYLSYALESIGHADAYSGYPERAATELGAAEALRESVGAPLTSLAQEAHDRVMAHIGTSLTALRLRDCFDEGRTLPPADAVRFACENKPVK